MEAADGEGVRRDGRAREGRHRQPGREAHGRPLLAARRRARARRRSSATAIERHAGAHPRLRRRTCTPARCDRRAPRSSRACSSSASAARRSGRSSWPTRSASPARPDAVHFFDNTDPDGIDRVLAAARRRARPRRSTVVISQVGRHQGDAQRHARGEGRATSAPGLDFAQARGRRHRRGQRARPARASSERLARALPDVGLGRRPHLASSRRSGLLPAALQGIDIDAHARGRARRRRASRAARRRAQNPAALLALMWYHAGDGRGQKDMVVLPYKDRLLLFSPLPAAARDGVARQGARPRRASVVHQGIAVYGNKGSTDQHAYVQQLRDGVAQLLRHLHRGAASDRAAGRASRSSRASPRATTSTGFLLGTRRALYENGRESITLTVRRRRRRARVGVLIALYERAVGLLRVARRTSTPTTSRASRRARRPPPPSSTSRRKVARGLADARRARSTPRRSPRAPARATSRPCSTYSSTCREPRRGVARRPAARPVDKSPPTQRIPADKTELSRRAKSAPSKAVSRSGVKAKTLEFWHITASIYREK